MTRGITQKCSGLTLIELMIVIAFIAVIMAMGVPAMTQVSIDGQATRTANALMSAMRTARSEAILSFQEPVIVCPSSDATSCGAAEDWSEGWIIFADDNDNGDLDNSDRVIRVEEGHPDVVEIRGIGLTNNRLVFDTEGMLAANSAFRLCDDRGSRHAKAIVINVSGQSRIATDDNSDGIVNTHLGNVDCD